MDKLKQIQEKIAEIQAKSAVAPELKAFATLFLKVLAEAKSNFSTISSENQAKFDQIINYLDQEHTKLVENVSQVTDTTKKDFENKLTELKDLIKKVQTIKPVDGVDGYTPVKGQDYFTDSDIKEIKDEVLKDIPPIEEETGESIVSKINDLPTDDEDLKIDAKHVKNFPEQVRYYAGGSGIKEIIAGTNITVDNSNLGYPVISSTGGGGGAVDSVNGQTGVVVLDADDIDDTSTTNKFVTSTDLTKLSNLSGTNTGDQDLSGYAPLTSPTFATSITGSYLTASELLITDASKNIVSAPVATYPSLTELTYLKGVTSAIQTQLNAKQPLDTQLTSLAGLSYSGNAGKFIRVNAGETDFELASVSGSGTVTSVAMSVPTGLTVTGSPITTTGTLALALDTGYVIPLQTTLDGFVTEDQTVGQTIGDTTNRLTKLWATDLTVTNAIAGSITGNAATVTNATLTTALTVNTGTVTLTGNVANNSVLTIGAGAVSVSGSNTGDVTVSDSAEIDFTLTGQQISASLVAGSIDETKLDASVNASLDLADSALQSSAIGVKVQEYDADLTTWAGITPGTGVGTALAVNVGIDGAFVVNGGDLGTPSSGTLTNATGLPISTGVSGLGTGVATALAVNTGSAGAFITYNGNAGTPSALVGTNITGTASGLTAGAVTGFTAGAGTLTGPASSGVAVTLGNAETITGAKTMSGLNIITHSSSGLIVRNPANTFSYTITGAAIAADRILNLPLITGTATLAVLSLAQTWTATQTMTSPSITTSIVTGSTTFSAFNTTATTLSIGGAATTLTIGGTPTTAITHNYSTNATATATTKTVNLGTGGAAGSTTNINIGSSVAGTTTISSPTISLGSTTGATTTGTIELGHASDTTLSRASAGVLNVEGVRVITSAGTTSGTILKNNGTTFVASTETYAAPGTSGNVMTSDGTNWTSAAPAGGGGYQILAEVDLSGGAAISLSSGTFTAKRWLRIICFDGGVNSSTQVYVRFNTDTGNNYLGNIMNNTTVDGSYTTAGIKTQTANNTIAKYIQLDVFNVSSLVKRFIGDSQPSSDEMIHYSGYWNNTTDAITSVQLSTANGTSTLPTTTRMIVLGMD